MQLIKQAQRCIPNTLTTNKISLYFTVSNDPKMGYCIIKIAYFQKPLKQIIKIWFVPPTYLWISTNRGRFLVSALSGAAQQFTAPYKKSLRVWCVPCRSTRLTFANQATINQFPTHSRHGILHKTSISLNESLSWHINPFKNNTVQCMPLLSSCAR